MTYHGHIKNGIAVLDAPVTLPDGTAVRVEVEPMSGDFWQGRGVEELAAVQGIEPCNDPGQWACDWPSGESVDDFLTFIRRSRV